MARAQHQEVAPLASGVTGVLVAIRMSVATAIKNNRIVAPTAPKPEPAVLDNGEHGAIVTTPNAPTARRKRLLAASMATAPKPEPAMRAFGRIMATAVMMTSVSMPATKAKAAAPMIAEPKPEPAVVDNGEHGENVPAKTHVIMAPAKLRVADIMVTVNPSVSAHPAYGATGPLAMIQTNVKTARWVSKAAASTMRAYKPDFVPTGYGAAGAIAMKKQSSTLNPLMTFALPVPKVPTAAAASASVTQMAAAFAHNIV